MIVKNYNVNDKNGLKETLSLMKDFEVKAVNDKDFRTFVFNNFGGFNKQQVLLKVWQYVKNNFTYTNDESAGVDELIIYPLRLIQLRHGDCDDFSLFIKSVLSVLNIPACYILFAKTKNNFSHIAVLSFNFILDGTNTGKVTLSGYNSKYKFFTLVK